MTSANSDHNEWLTTFEYQMVRHQLLQKKCMVQNLENVLNLNVCQTEQAKPEGCDTLQDEWQIHPTLGLKLCV